MGQTVKKKTCRCEVVGVEWQIEREESERKRSGCNEQEASGMNSQRWPRMAGLNWPGSGRWRLGGGLRGSCTSSWTERERQKDDGGRERGPRAPTGVALHSSWGLTADLDLWIFLSASMSLSLALSPPNQNTCFNSEGYTHDRLRYVPPCSLFFISYGKSLNQAAARPQFITQLPAVQKTNNSSLTLKVSLHACCCRWSLSVDWLSGISDGM